MNTEERMKILKMVADGILSIEEAEKLLDVLEEKQDTAIDSAPAGEPWISNGMKGKWLRILVTDLKTNHKKVNIRIPASLISAGLKIGAKFAPEMEGIDPTEILEALNNDIHGKFVDVTDEKEGEHVEIMIE